jgi:farnesyl diphosphate synthase
MTTGTALLDFAKRLDQTAEDTEALLSKLLSRELLPDEIARPKRLIEPCVTRASAAANA